MINDGTKPVSKQASVLAGVCWAAKCLEVEAYGASTTLLSVLATRQSTGTCVLHSFLILFLCRFVSKQLRRFVYPQTYEQVRKSRCVNVVDGQVLGLVEFEIVVFLSCSPVFV